MSRYNIPYFEYAPDNELQQLPQQLQSSIESFARDGYVVIDPDIKESCINTALEFLQPHFFTSDGELKAKRVHNAWKNANAIREIACAPKVLATLEQLYGRQAIPFQTLNFPVGTEQRTHSDSMHFNSFPPRFMCGVWVALEDIDEFNGPLHYYPGSHGLTDFQMFDCMGENANNAAIPSQQDYYDYYESFLESILKKSPYERKEVLLKKGQALIWSAKLCHGGSPIRDPSRTRFTQVTHYFFSDCTYYTPRRSHPYQGRLWLRCIEDISTGKRVNHRIGNNAFEVPVPGPYVMNRSGEVKSLNPRKRLEQVRAGITRRIKSFLST